MIKKVTREENSKKKKKNLKLWKLDFSLRRPIYIAGFKE
jgi:hypothetical protein